MLFQRLLLSIALAFTTPAFAKKAKSTKKRTPAQQKQIETLNSQVSKEKPLPKKASVANRGMAISYGSPSWNTDSTKIDSAYLMMRDKNTGKIVQIQLEESEPDSSNFVGRFSISHGEASKIAPEVFIPSPEMRGEENNKKLFEMIQSGKAEGKPLVWKEKENGQTLVDVYDTKAQADAAQSAFDTEKKAEADIKKKKMLKSAASDQALAAAQQAERKAMLDKLAMEAAKRETDRVRMEQIEKQKAEEREKASKALSEAERAARKAHASKLNEEAVALYIKGDFVGAETKFRQAVELDPENKQIYFQYGITLYRNNKFNEALVVMKLADVDKSKETEKRYYMGLIHYRLKELKPALTEFGTVSKAGDKSLSPSAEFYAGLIQFTLENYDAAKKSFETVIDTSSDPRLDEQAEQYLDQIANAMAYKKMRENKFTLTATVGAMYDSNVLLSPDNAGDQGSATDTKDFRLLTTADLEYRPIFKEHHEWFAKANASLTNSMKDESAIADPWVYSLALPYSYKGTMGKKGIKATLKPGYEILYMDPTNTGTKSNIQSSYYLTADTTFVMSQTWFANYSLEYRADDSKLASSTGDDNSDATKYTLKTTQSFFLDKARKEAFMANAAYVMNDATGKEARYGRIELGATYVRPTKWNASWLGGLTLYQLKYDDATEARTDINTTLMTGFSKPVKEWVTWGVIGTYTKNDSNIDDNEYSRYMIMTTATFVTNF